MTDDSSLLRRYVEHGSEEAFTELVRRHIDHVFSAVLRRVGNDVHLAEDVTQSVFITFARKAPTLLGHPVLGGWLHRCTQFAAVDAVRTQRRQARHDERAQVIIADAKMDTMADVEWKNLGPMLDALIDELNERERDAIVLRFFEGRSFAEIGAALRLNEDAARMRVNRALERLRELLTRRGMISSAAALGLALANSATVAAPVKLTGTVAGVALANAAAANVGVAGTQSFLNSMSTTKTIASIATVVAILSIGVAVRQSMALHATRTALAQATQMLASADPHERPATDAERTSPDHANSIKSRQPGAESKSPGESQPPDSNDARMVTVHMADILKENPKYAAIYDQDMRRNVIRTYGDYLPSLGLPSDQLKRLEGLLAEEAMSGMDAQLAAEARGLERGSSAWAQAISQARHEVDSEINSILGTYGNMNLSDLKDRSSIMHQIENNYGPDFADSGIPLSPDQYRALTQAFVDASTAIKNLPEGSSTFTQPDSATGLSEQDNKILAKASKLLSPAQLEILKNARIESHERDSVQEKYAPGDKRLAIKTP